MPVTHLHSYLIYPGKNVEKSELHSIHGTTLDLSGKLFDMLNQIYNRTADECKTGVRFESTNQTNPARDLIVGYAQRPRKDTGLKLAKRLQLFTSGTPGMGLLFLLRGKEGKKTKTLISRFPADVGILAEEQTSGLNIEYLEKVFMKNSNKYKAACYEDESLSKKTGYWKGIIVDHQIHYGVVRTVSDYWVKDFLASDCLTTPAMGSSRLAKMIGEAVKKTANPNIKSELVSVARLIPNLDGKKVSGEIISKQFSLSDSAAKAFEEEAKSNELFKEEFMLDANAFRDVLSYESRELNTGAILTAPAGQFKELFTEKVVNKDKGISLYSTEGELADLRLKKTKP
ncbi:hypothetical protein F1728_06605 [Gimesia benthica]|uniref:Nucleoid-associated protein n=1 Tax=Gimesia benthica TaxID=2608982 RepID=A0A6I6A877_9PLAN|nr:hypothetical protein [Gimesia benthica]QGQ22363.1 hypothetical protein F1728_06605 [Gimesia benthica]